jgi:hypothetical protein
MFGHDDNNQAVMGSPTVQNPSMLDNVNTNDFQGSDDSNAATDDTAAPTTPMQDMMAANMMGGPAAAPADDPATQPTTDDQTAATPVQTDDTATEHTLTTDNPFVQDASAATDPAADQPDDGVTTTTTTDSTTTTTVDSTPMSDANGSVAQDSGSPSGPIDPPVVQPADESTDDSQDQSDYMTAITDGASQPIDKDRLAEMKQEALAHLEPLADHVGGTPEETFKTTMMMIQANDNHTLLEKALAAAKQIEDDKTRAQAMLDIINEINYFSQQ